MVTIIDNIHIFRFINFPDQPIVWREIGVITAALRSDSQDKHAQFLRGYCLLQRHFLFRWVINKLNTDLKHDSPHPGLFETLPGRVQCEMLLKATEQCFNTLEKAEMLLLLLKRFPESVVQHGVCATTIALVYFYFYLCICCNLAFLPLFSP